MDYHFFTTSQTEKRKDSNIGRVLKLFVPVFAVSALMPVFLFYFLNPPKYDFTPQASELNKVRIWFEPQTLSTQVGKQAKITLFASIEDETRLVQSINLSLIGPANVNVNPSNIIYTTPFNGKVILSEIEFFSFNEGSYELSINPKDIQIIGEYEVVTNSATIHVTPN